MECDYLLEMKNISKNYSGNQVLKDVELKVKPGEIHCLVGENGAGKSTLMNILFGMGVIHNTGGFEGEVYFEGEKIDVKSPKEAMQLGIGMVHQEFMLIPEFTITENIKLNREILKDNLVSRALGEKLKTVDFRKMNKDARKALDTLEINIDEWIKVAGLPVGHMQFIEIAREIDKKNVKLLVFDEPTAVLAESEAKNLLTAMKKIANSGIAILFITHRLDEVISIADNVTILRDGVRVCNKRADETDVGELAELMVGRKIDIQNKQVSEDFTQEIILDIKNLYVDMPGEKVKGINLQIRKGEIFGIGGLAGQGKIGLANGIMGLYPSKGQVLYNGEELILNDTKNTLKKGFAFVSENRKNVGLILDESIELNMIFTALNIKEQFLINLGFFKLKNFTKIKKYSMKRIKELDIRCTSSRQHVGRLSGGNQQKVCIARALTQEPDVLFVSEPTRGIDIGAKKLVLDLLLKLNEELGMTIIMTSSELAEVRSIADRIAIISEGKLAGILRPSDTNKKFGLLMSGIPLNKIMEEEA
ncbi:sugar ABC transporter ATP-binding protein [Vallitalea maricola]|uniref:Sugar ABC transporter ATP-binding protein n=1 Tax=Vallitalea maricola TaxID=3074433 RepID=A0ACB5UEN6_9FIRM|nr:sugar ABC transporter ATP-binding protein [Vallitalea sp. AN17-2]